VAGATNTPGSRLTAIAWALFRAYARHPERHELLFELYDLELVLYAPAWLLASAL
jgi:hypothetical protein